MADLVALFGRAVEGFAQRVAAIAPDQWGAPTPNTEWDVRTLVNHLVVEDLWAPRLLDGMTIAEVGDRFDGDQLGDDPHAAWAQAAAEAVAAAGRPGVLERTVHVSSGDISAREYLSQLTCDHLIHAWDLARAIGADERIDEEGVAFAMDYLAPHLRGWQSSGAFAPPIEVPEEAGAQARLLGLTGRRP